MNETKTEIKGKLEAALTALDIVDNIEDARQIAHTRQLAIARKLIIEAQSSIDLII